MIKKVVIILELLVLLNVGLAIAETELSYKILSYDADTSSMMVNIYENTIPIFSSVKMDMLPLVSVEETINNLYVNYLDKKGVITEISNNLNKEIKIKLK